MKPLALKTTSSVLAFCAGVPTAWTWHGNSTVVKMDQNSLPNCPPAATPATIEPAPAEQSASPKHPAEVTLAKGLKIVPDQVG